MMKGDLYLKFLTTLILGPSSETMDFALPLKMMLKQGLKHARSSYLVLLLLLEGRRYAPTFHKIILPIAVVLGLSLLTLLLLIKKGKDVIALEMECVVILHVVQLKSASPLQLVFLVFAVNLNFSIGNSAPGDHFFQTVPDDHANQVASFNPILIVAIGHPRSLTIALKLMLVKSYLEMLNQSLLL